MTKLLTLIVMMGWCVGTFAQTDTTSLSTDTTDVPISEIERAAEEAVRAVEEAVEAAAAAVEAAASESEESEADTTDGVDELIIMDDYDEPDYERTYFDEEDTIGLYSEGFEGLSMLDDVVGEYQVFITGENHTYTESNARLWLKMIKYLHQNAGVRNVMFEYGYSYGFLVNEYLKTGDTTLFSSIDQFAYIEYSNALEDLKAYNDSLPEDEKLYFTAIDIERGVYPVAKILAYLLPEEFEAHDSIDLHVQSLKSLAAYNDFKLDEQDEEGGSGYGFTFKSGATIDLVHANFLKFEEHYKALLGDNFEEFKLIIVDNYLARKQWMTYDSEGAIQEYIYRENYMHNRFLDEYKKHPGNWFGQFGRCHTTLTKQNSNSCEWFEFNSLADRIEHTEGGAFADQVMSIAILYEDDRNTGPDRDSLEERFDKFFDDITENSVVLLDIASDSVLNKAYGKDFKFIFLNTNTQKGEVYDYLNEYISTADDDDNFKLVTGFTQHKVDLTSLNARFTDYLDGVSSEFNGILEGFEFGGLGGADGFMTGFSVGWFSGQNVSLNNGSSYDLTGFYIKDASFYNVTKSMDWLDVMPGMALGYHQLKLTTQESDGNQGNVGTGFLGNIKNVVYTNPAFVFDLSGIIDINLGKLTLGYHGGINFDLSKKEWLTDGEIIENSPRTSFRGVFQTIRLGANF